MERRQDELRAPHALLARVKQEPLDEYGEGGNAESRISQLLQLLSQNEARASEAEDEHTSQMMEWLDKYNESETCRIAAEMEADEERRRRSELERTSAKELRELNTRYVAALATVSEKTNRAKEMMEEKEGLRKELEEMRKISEKLEREKEGLERGMADLKRSNEEWTMKWEESEKERAELEETQKILINKRASLDIANERLEREEKIRMKLNESLAEADTIMTGLQSSLKEANEKLEEERKMKDQFKGERDIFEYQCKNGKVRGEGWESSESWRDRRLGDLQEENKELKERVESYKKRVRYHDNQEKELEETENRVKKLEKKKEKLSKEVEEAEKSCNKLERERDELKIALNEKSEREMNFEINKYAIASLESERNDLKRKLQIQMGVSMENAFLKSHCAKLEKLMEERKEEEKSMKYKKMKMEEEEEELGRRMEEVERMKKEMEERLMEMEEERDLEVSEAQKQLARIIAQEKEALLREMEKENEMKRAETEKELARYSQVDEEMNQLRTVNAFLVTTPIGKIYLELQQCQEREAQLKQTLEALKGSVSRCKLEEEENEDGEMKRKKARMNTPKEEQVDENDEGVENGEELEEGEIEENEPEFFTPPPAFLQEFIARRENGTVV